MKKVLIIEDDFYVRGLYKMAFQKKDYQVTEAESGQKALGKIEKEDFTFIILDLMLPGLSGMKILKNIRNLKQTPVFVLSNVGEEETIREAIKEGATAYFLKVDYTPKQLVAALEEKLKEISK